MVIMKTSSLRKFVSPQGILVDPLEGMLIEIPWRKFTLDSEAHRVMLSGTAATRGRDAMPWASVIPRSSTAGNVAAHAVQLAKRFTDIRYSPRLGY
jgi:hypothetical protein